jgi:hypothetical protein
MGSPGQYDPIPALSTLFVLFVTAHLGYGEMLTTLIEEAPYCDNRLLDNTR